MTDGDHQAEPLKPPSEAGHAPRSSIAWQPLTPRGISAFAHAGYGRLMLVALTIAASIAVLGCWFVDRTVMPAVEKAILVLPDTGSIQGRELGFPEKVGPVLVEERVLGILVNLDGREHASMASDFQIILRKRDVQICSLLGCLGLDYPNGWIIDVNRTRWEPALPAWKPMILGVLFLCEVAWLLVCLHAMAVVYCLATWFLSYYSDRGLSLKQCWMVAFASLLPGALIMGGAIVLYGFGSIDLVRLSVVGILHLVVPWVLIPLCIRALPAVDSRSEGKQNPFGPPPPPASPETSTSPVHRPNKNPFADPVTHASPKENA